jgi:hypothetical protein
MFRGLDRGGARECTARRTRAARLPSALAALALGLALSGCGSTKPLTRAQLVSHANALCTQVQTKMKHVGTANTVQGLAHIAHKLAGFEQQQLESMKQLKPPTSLGADWKQMIEGAEEVAEDAGSLSTDVQLKKKKAAIEQLKQIGTVEKRISPIAKRDGFTSCTQF